MHTHAGGRIPPLSYRPFIQSRVVRVCPCPCVARACALSLLVYVCACVGARVQCVCVCVCVCVYACVCARVDTKPSKGVIDFQHIISVTKRISMV
jgi:hypothetical protein